MATHTLNFFDLSYASTDDPDGFSNPGGWQFDWGVSTITIAPGATETAVSVEDVDGFFDDDQGASQTLNGPAMLNGITYPHGTFIESEYGVVVEDSLGNSYTFQFVSIDDDAYDIIGFVIHGPVPPFGEALTVTSASDGHSGTYAYSTSSPACFGRTARIATARGPVRAMDLVAGDIVRLADGNTAGVALVLTASVTAATAAARDTLPVRIRKGAFGPGLPKRDLILSPQHRVWVPALGALVAARALVCLPKVGLMRGAVEGLVHVVLATHEVLLAEGLPCESFWPGPVALSMLPPVARRRVTRIMGDALPAAPFLPVRQARARLIALRAEEASAAPVGGISIGREEEGHMVMRPGVGHAEPDRHDVEEQRLLPRLAGAAQVVPGIENQFVDAGGKIRRREDRRIGPPVVVCDGVGNAGEAFVVHPEKRDAQPRRRLARRGVQHMGRQVSIGHFRGPPLS